MILAVRHLMRGVSENKGKAKAIVLKNPVSEFSGQPVRKMSS